MFCFRISLGLTAAVFASSLCAQNGYIQDQDRAKQLMTQCLKPESQRRGSQEWKECLEGTELWQATSDRLNRDIANTVQRREADRQRIQQEEIWREQVRLR